MIAHALATIRTTPIPPLSRAGCWLVAVQDAVSQDAPQAIAERERDRQSVRRKRSGVDNAAMPDLTIYDVIRIDDPSMPLASGLWAMNSIDDTDTGSDALQPDYRRWLIWISTMDSRALLEEGRYGAARFRTRCQSRRRW